MPSLTGKYMRIFMNVDKEYDRSPQCQPCRDVPGKLLLETSLRTKARLAFQYPESRIYLSRLEADPGWKAEARGTVTRSQTCDFGCQSQTSVPAVAQEEIPARKRLNQLNHGGAPVHQNFACRLM